MTKTDLLTKLNYILQAPSTTSVRAYDTVIKEAIRHIESDVITCGECLFYTPKPDDPLMGLCGYKNRTETVFDDDYCSRGERSKKDV